MSRPRRRTQAERSETMRGKLASAAFEVIAERGHSAFRTAAVLAHAGVSQGALLHHFPTKDALTLAAIDYALTLSNSTSLERLAAAGETREEVIRAMVADYRDFFMGDRFWVSLDITMDASKDSGIAPAIRTIVAEARAPVYRAWTDRLIVGGLDAEAAENAVVTTAALISGYAIRSLWADDDSACERAIDRWLDTLLSSPTMD